MCKNQVIRTSSHAHQMTVLGQASMHIHVVVLENTPNIPLMITNMILHVCVMGLYGQLAQILV